MVDENLKVREIEAFEGISDALKSIAETLRLSYRLKEELSRKQYPEKAQPREAIVTHLETEEERLQRSQGASEEDDQEWSRLGPRERQFLVDERAEKLRKSKRSSKASRRNA